MQSAKRDNWLKDRQKGIGGSDIAAILGKSPFKTALSVWSDKRHISKPWAGNKNTKWGQLQECVILQQYKEQTGRNLKCFTNSPKIFRNEKYPLFGVSPDSVWLRDEGGTEAKNVSSMGYDWSGAEWPPDYYVLQCHGCMMALNKPRWDLAALIDGHEFRIFELHADQEFHAMLYAKCEAWWKQFVETGVEPPALSPDDMSEFLGCKYPKNNGVMLKSTPTVETLIGMLEHAKKQAWEWEDGIDTYKNALRAVIGDADGIILASGKKITWKKNKDGSKTDWPSVVASLRAHADNAVINELIELHTETTIGPRVFRDPFQREKDKGEKS